MSDLDLSIVVPVRDEAESVAPLHREVASVMAGLGAAFELIFVDDGSADATFEHLRSLHAEHGAVRAVRLAEQFGKSAALAAGFAAARGRVIITLDGDLQDDPREIPRFLAALDEGLDLVCGWRRPRSDSWGKSAASRIFNWTVSRLTGLRLHDINCGFKAYRAQAARNLPLRHGLHRFIPVLARAWGCRIGEIVVAHRGRSHGRSKYGWGRVLEALVDMHLAWLVTRRCERPLRVFGLMGAALLLPGAGVIAAAAVRAPVVAWLWLTVGALFALGGVHFLAMAHLTRRALAGEPQGARYSIAEQLD